MARKGKYDEWLDEAGLAKIGGWARDGLTEKQIAKNIGITQQTLDVWKNKYPSLAETLKKNREVADREVENALFRKACGYTAKVIRSTKVKHVEYDAAGKKKKEWEEIVPTEEEVHIPADTTAQIFWLKNRKPDAWRNKPEIVTENEGEETGVIEIPMVQETQDE